jgi:hypothetical protein
VLDALGFLRRPSDRVSILPCGRVEVADPIMPSFFALGFRLEFRKRERGGMTAVILVLYPTGP